VLGWLGNGCILTTKIQLAGFESDVDWLVGLNAELADTPEVTIWHPAHPRPLGVCVMFLDVRDDSHLVFHPDAAGHVAKKADAYAGTTQGLQEALDWLARGAPTPERGLVYLGGLGVSGSALTVGEPVLVEEQIVAGRSAGCHVPLRHGAHSDQNVCARRHAILKRSSDSREGIVVVDLKSTNGTYVDGQIVVEPTLVRAGSEIAFAGYFRFRVCG